MLLFFSSTSINKLRSQRRQLLRFATNSRSSLFLAINSTDWKAKSLTFYHLRKLFPTSRNNLLPYLSSFCFVMSFAMRSINFGAKFPSS